MATSSITTEPLRSLHIALQEAERIHIELTAEVDRLIALKDAGEQVDENTYWAANAAADRAEHDFAAIQRAFLDVSRAPSLADQAGEDVEAQHML